MVNEPASRTIASRHDHIFGQDVPTTGERRTLVVVVLTAVTMVFEIAAGLAYGSMALLADGLHMASHAVALGIAVFAYRYARRHARDPRFSFGTGKVNSLAGYSGAILLGVFALGMAAESIERFITPVDIAINQALIVAVVGLLVNGASVFVLGAGGAQHHGHGHDHSRGHGHQDHNFRSAYLHVLADALTSLLAIAALLSAKYFGLSWLDPMMGIVGAVLVARWSVGLLRESSQVLLDRQAPNEVIERVRCALEEPGTEIADLHIWSIAPGQRAAIVAIEAQAPRPVDEYRQRLPKDLGLSHVTLEITRFPSVQR